jgi:hypothetical protein
MTDHASFTEIAKVVGTYVEGMCQSDPVKLRRSMHEKACSIGHFAGSLEWDNREAFIAAVATAVKSPDPEPWFEIRAIGVTGDVATVEVEDIWLGDRFTDMLTLLHHEGRWVIVSKVFLHRGRA